MTGFLNSRTEARFPRPAKRGPKPKRPIRRRAKRKAKMRDADKLFSEYIRTRDGWACKRCGSPYSSQCAHIVSRSYRGTRWTAENAICLCASCHQYFHHRPLEWADFLNERWPGRLARMEAQARALIGAVKVDYDEVCESLRLAIGVRGDK